jgi:hypothetical protein
LWIEGRGNLRMQGMIGLEKPQFKSILYIAWVGSRPDLRLQNSVLLSLSPRHLLRPHRPKIKGLMSLSLSHQKATNFEHYFWDLLGEVT